MSNSDKISEKKYKKLANEMEMILDNIPGLVFYKDTKNNLIRVNKYFADSHKLNKKELEGKSCFDLYPKEQAQAYWDDDLEVINSGKPKLNVLEPWEIESGVRWLSTNKIPFYDVKGKCTGIISFSKDVTEEIRAERKLKEYSRNLEDLVEQRTLNLKKQMEENQLYLDVAGVMLLVINADETIKIINKKGCEILACDEEQLIGKNWFDKFIPKEKQKEIKSVFRKIMAGEIEPVEYYENPILTKEGKEKLIAWHNTVLKDKQGNIVGTLSSGEDITERKNAEKVIQENAENFMNIVDNSPDGFIIADEKGRHLFANQRAAEITGYSIEELVGMTDWELSRPEDKEELMERMKKRMRGETHEKIYERTLLRKDGSEILTGFRTTKTIWKGKISHMVVIRDITAYKKAELELRLERDNLINILNSIEDGVYIVDQNYNIEFTNPYMSQEYDQYEGKKCYEYLYDLNEPCSWCKNKEVFEGKTVRWEWYSQRNQKFLYNIETPIRNADGSVSKLYISRDITKIKKVEQDLLSTLENLKSVNIELERFAYVASHDLQEPLRMIVSFIQLLEKRYKDKLDEDADEFITFIVDGAKRMQALINDLLSYSRIGRKDKQLSHLDLNIVIKTVINNLKKSIVETDAQITYDPLPKILGNEAEFIQLLQNLISNAIKFHKEEETPVVHISAKLQKNQWIFSVRDNGIGIDSQYFDRIFIFFQRWHKKDEFGGTGIGLTICKKIIELHSGKIWVESELGKGSTFYFSIPKTEVRK